MEMCYDGALVLPSSYAVMDEEEMTYVDGGWSGKTFASNLKGAYNQYKHVRNALLGGGLTLGAIAKTAYMTAKSVYVLCSNDIRYCKFNRWYSDRNDNCSEYCGRHNLFR